MKQAIFAFSLGCALSVLAAPQLKTQAELVADGELKAKVLAGARGVPAPTPESRQYEMTRGTEKKKVKFYLPADLWRQRAFAGEWKDKKGNVMRLARVKSLCPSFEREDWYKEEIEERLGEMEGAFRGTEDELAEWRGLWGGKGSGRFFEAKNGTRWYVEFDFAEKVSQKDAEKLLKAFEKSVSTMTKSGGAGISSMRWWEQENPQYKFMTDLDKAKGGKFIKDAMKLMGAMRRSYEFYVPPDHELGVCTVRVFKELAGYREYRSSTGVDEEMSCGLWDPNREELLISAEDPKEAQGTMRHEAFHQYLHYATGRGDHAMWFNEGHATFFENVQYNPAKNTVKVIEKGNRSKWVSRDPARYANAIASVLQKDHKAFYSGDVNLNYCTAWAICYFLEKGAYTSDEFAPYRGICRKYLELMAQGASASDATNQAWALVKDRNVAADFLKFWKEKRKQALNAR